MKTEEFRELLSTIESQRKKYEQSGYGEESQTTAYVDGLARCECAGLTARRARFEGEQGVARDPIVLSRGKGAFLWDVDGLAYVDMGGCFAVSAYGHANEELCDVLEAQARSLMHGMGDVYPTDVKVKFLQALSEAAPGELSGALLSQSGAEAVETAIKMAQMATKRSRLIAFESSYHGLSYGALSVTGHQNDFKTPFSARISALTTFVPYANCLRCAFGKTPQACGFACLRHLERVLDAPGAGVNDVAAVIVEPIQGRGGDVVPPSGWLRALRALCDRHGILLIFDEIYTGFGRTGKLFACEHEGVVPDIMCLGKAMTGGFPLSATLATPAVLSHWPLNRSEAIHTSTFLGNPMGCAMGLKALEIQKRDALAQRAQKEGGYLLSEMQRLKEKYPQIIAQARGRGLMVGIEMAAPDLEPLTALALQVVDRMRDRGFILLPSGAWSHVISVAPPLVIEHACLEAFVKNLDEVLNELSGAA